MADQDFSDIDDLIGGQLTGTIPTGVPQLDETLGAQKGRMDHSKAPGNPGKSSYLLQAVRYAKDTGKNIVHVDLDTEGSMSDEEKARWMKEIFGS